jgi:hypothetical protein
MHLDYETHRTRPQPNGIGLAIRLIFFGTIGAFGWLLLLASAFGGADRGWMGVGLGGAVGLICGSRVWRLVRGTKSPTPPS